MKKTLFLLLLLISYSRLTFSQGSEIKIRHMEGKKAIKIGQAFLFGNDKHTMTSLLGYNQYLSDKLFIDAALNMEYGTIQQSKMNSIYLRLNANYSLLNVENTFYVNVAGGVFGGRESAKSEVLINFDPLHNFVGGIDLGITSEFFINNTFCIEPFAYQYFQTGSALGSSFYNIGLNLKINF
jgi:hypothetical protein